jgi:arginyl-tRNA synthetase
LKSIHEQLSSRLRQAMARVGVEGDPLVRISQDAKFGDYQSNCAMGLAKKAGKKPRDIAQAIIDHLDIDDLCEPATIAGPGFINMRLRPSFLAACLAAIEPCGDSAVDRLGIAQVPEPQTVVVDLSSPNLAKEMHIGHLRSTVIGDCVARVLEFVGHTVHRENHVGDWGTQFGMLLAHLRSIHPEIVERPDELVIGDLESFYVDAKSRFDQDEAFKKESRDTVVALQGGDTATRLIWKAFCAESLRHCHEIYDRLGVKLVDRGESFYTELMGEVVARFERMIADGSDLVRVSDGALCLFMEGFTSRDGDPLPMIVRKSDGGFNYATSDIATIMHRVEKLGAKRIIYVVGLPQKHHFEMLFAGVRQAGFVSDDVSLEHLGFGSVLSATGRPFKTREGGAVKLKDVLDEAVARARATVDSAENGGGGERRTYTDDQAGEIAERVGLAAVKYFDLSHSLSGDYRFDVATMLNMEGNTAPYLMYAYARVRSIGRKAGIDFAAIPVDTPMVLEHPTEVNLGLKILQFQELVGVLARDLRPNVLTDYLFELAKCFSRFYDKKLGVRVIDASPEAVRLSRLKLCDLTARTLSVGLGLIGIETVEQM